MSPIIKKSAGPLAVVIVLIITVAVWHISHRASVVETGPTQSVGDFDHFQQDLATRVLNQLGTGSDFSVIVATASYPPGTLLRATGSIPADLEDCVPATLPRLFSAPRLFPSYTMSSDTALALNLGSGAIRGLDSAGLSLGQSQNIQYTIENTQIQIMDDRSVEQVTGQGSCGKYIAEHPGIRLVRGAVVGKMTFTVKVSDPASMKAQLANIGGLSVNDNPQMSTLSIADKDDEPIVQLLSEFGSTASASSVALTPKPVANAPVANAPVAMSPAPSANRSPAAVEVQDRPHMYVQIDAQDNSSSGANVVQLLRTGWPSAIVESKVERIPTDKMPNTPQIRYFNAADADRASRCASILKPAYPNMQVVREGLPSPKGQLEVWLPKAKPGR